MEPRDPNRKRICVMGTSVSTGNRGVMALRASLVGLLLRFRPESELTILAGHEKPCTVRIKQGELEKSIPVVNYRLSPAATPREHLLFILVIAVLYRLLPFAGLRARLATATPWIRAIAEADLVGDVRGGDSFSDIYGLGRFLLGFLAAWTVLLVKGEIVQFPQTYGPYKSAIARRLARYLLRRSSVIIARDAQSQRVAQELVAGEKAVLLSPDVAFALEAVRPRSIRMDPPLDARVAPAPLGLNVSGLMFNGGYTRRNMFGLRLEYQEFLTAIVTKLLTEHSGELWLLPHTFAPPDNVEDDYEASRRLRKTLPSDLRARVRLLGRDYDCHEIKGVIGMCDFFVGSRMHSCIAALSQGVPCVGVAYSMKFGGVFESVGMGEWVVDGRNVAIPEAAERVITLYRRRDEVREGLKQRAQTARLRLAEVFEQLASRLGPAGAERKAEACPVRCQCSASP